MATKDIDRWLE